MNYRYIKVGEEIPKIAEVNFPFLGWLPYYNEDHPYDVYKGEKNIVFGDTGVRVPIEEDTTV
ncbi:MAG: hypothetical protein BWY21_00958 [Parcubacteria group bacterium ADurb.Bin216]|nr:MAG: hypothetical protein BWY21_00958 [Parcubacteria group bacterium ADurb.Bin216]